MVTIVFDGSFDGFLCVIYAVYYQKIDPVSIQTNDRVQLALGDEMHQVETDSSHASRVMNGLKAKISEDAASRIYYAFLSGEEDKYMAMLQYIRLGFKVGHMVDSHLREDCVRRVHKLSANVGKETHLLTGFCRFAETVSGVFYCQITPKNDVLALVASHFIERLMGQPWVIHDKSRNKAAVYDGKSYVIADVPKEANVVYAEGEKETQELWVAFFNALAIEARKNYKLQRQLLPLYFRKNMTEFNQLPNVSSQPRLQDK